MADHTITISNNLRFYGPGVASYWGTLVWGTNVWATDRDTDFVIGKGIANGVTVTDTGTDFAIGKWLSETISTDTTIGKTLTRTIPDFGTINLTSAINFVSLKSGNWTYVLKGATDPDDRNFPTYSEISGSSPTYSEVSGTDPGWSET